jgi:hypothetical protein
MFWFIKLGLKIIMILRHSRASQTYGAYRSLENMFKCRFLFRRNGLKFCISNRLPGDARSIDSILKSQNASSSEARIAQL